MGNNYVVVDASLILKLVLPEPYSATAQTLWMAWIASDTEICAPCHLEFETVSVIRNRVHRNLLTAEQGAAAYHALMALEVTLMHPGTLHEGAWAFAETYHRPTAYDAYYLALADELDCEFWTADDRLVRAAVNLPRIHSLSSHAP